MLRRLSNKKLLPLYLAIPALILISFFLFSAGNDTRKFDKLAETIFQTELSENTLSLHYTLAYPENFGIAHYEPTLPCYSISGTETADAALDLYITELSGIDSQNLDENRKYTYDLLSRFFNHLEEGSAFTYYEEPLSPSSGMQSQLPILLAEYTFRDVDDVEDYLGILDKTDEYFASLLAFEQEKKAAGLLQADTSLNKVREQCYTILSKKELEAGTHFLQTTFSERLQTLFSAGLLNESQLASYKAENDRLLTTVMQPAYEVLADGLFVLTGDGTSTPKGLCSRPLGKDYYIWLVEKNTGSSLTIEEIKGLLYPKFDMEYETLRSLLLEREDSVDVWADALSAKDFFVESPTDMLADLQMRMAQDFPAFPEITGHIKKPGPDVCVKTVSDSLENYCAPAFYLTPPLDDTDNNVIYINEQSTPAGLELYTTLAHEGYPGHLYQSVYSQLNLLQNENNHVRQVLWYGGYLEGWAIYVEFESYDYAAAIANAQGDPDAAYAYEIEKHNRNMQLCLYALLDIAIHHDGATLSQVQQVLASLGIESEETARNVYDYIAEEPANYLKYYLGYLEILRLKETAMDLWGENYSDLRFHTFFLNCGPSDFTTLSEALKKSPYIHKSSPIVY